MKLTLQLRARLAQARSTLTARDGVDTARWSDDQTLSALSLVNTGLRGVDAAAIVIGDAVLEDGRVDYNPGCAWIDDVLARRSRTRAECERILAQWEAPCGQDAEIRTGSNVVRLPLSRTDRARTAARSH